MGLNERGRKAQAEVLRRNGYERDAKAVERGDVEFDAEWLESIAMPQARPGGTQPGRR